MKIDEKYKLLSLKGTPQTVAEIAHEITKGGRHSIQDQLEIKMGNKTGDKRDRWTQHPRQGRHTKKALRKQH